MHAHAYYIYIYCVIICTSISQMEQVAPLAAGRELWRQLELLGAKRCWR
jgi:hypothetical protein